MAGFDQMTVEALLSELKGIRKALADMSQEVTTIRREIAGAGAEKPGIGPTLVGINMAAHQLAAGRD
jgi:hypothetical protein